MSDFNCPYCGAPQEVCHDDGHGMDEDIVHQHQCAKCEKYFAFTTYISIHHTARKADCLNTEIHNWAPTHTYPKEFSRMECRACGSKRQPTEAERAMIMGTAKPSGGS